MVRLLVGKAASEYSFLEGSDFVVSNSDEVRAVIERVSGFSSGRGVSIAGIDNLSPRALDLLLKWLEETSLEVVLLAKEDIYCPALVSRCGTWEKRVQVGQSEFISFRSFVREGYLEGMDDQVVLKYCPLAYFHQRATGRGGRNIWDLFV
jgi:hypothetical protein